MTYSLRKSTRLQSKAQKAPKQSKKQNLAPKVSRKKVLRKKTRSEKKPSQKIIEFHGWHQADSFLDSFDEDVLIMCTGELWGCGPCVRAKPWFHLQKTKIKIVVNVGAYDKNDWGVHHGINIKYVPTFILRERGVFRKIQYG
jgi:hypothetical protein